MAIIALSGVAGSIGNGDGVQITAEADLLGQAVNNVWYAYADGGSVLFGSEAIDEMNALADAMMNLYTGNIMALLSAELTLDQARTKKIQQRITTGIGPFEGKWIFDIQGIKVNPSAGAKVGDVAPSYVAGTVNLISGDAGRHFRGSKRFGGLVEDDTDGNVFTPGVFGDWVDAFETLLTDWGAAVTAAGCDLPWKLVIATNTLAPPTPATSSNFYVSLLGTAVPQRVLGSQVSRKQKRRFA